MTIARLRLPFKEPKSRSSFFILARYRGVMAGIAAVAWVVCLELVMGGQ
jgi:hypothetical protein